MNEKTKMMVLVLLIFRCAGLSPAFAQVQQAWVAQYDGVPNAMAVDDVGNLYVTGSSVSSRGTGLFDYLTVKYDAFGRQQWAARSNGGCGSERHITVDNTGNVPLGT